MSALEQHHRAALRWYPAPWRARNEEVVLGTLLDKAEADGRTRPGPSERVNLAAHGIANHFRGLPSAIPSPIRNRTSTAALAIGAAISLAATMQLEGPPARYIEFFGAEPATFGPFASPTVIVYIAWIIAFFAAIAGRATATRLVAAATIPLTIGTRIFADASDMFLRPTWTFLGLLLLLSLLVVVGSPAPGRRGVRWLVAWFAPALVAFTLPQTLFNQNGVVFQNPLWIARADVLALSPIIAVGVAALAYLAAKPSWSAAVLLVATPFTAAALFGATSSNGAGSTALMIALAALALALLLQRFGVSMRIERIPSAPNTASKPSGTLP